MGITNRTGNSFPHWPATIIVNQLDSTSMTGDRGGNETKGWEESVTLKILTAEHGNSNIWESPLEVEAVDGCRQSVLTDVLASVLIFLSIVCNAAVLVITSYRIFRQKNKSAIHLFLWNLAIADILVSTVLLPYQAGWIRTERWNAGEIACKMLAFSSSFAYFLSGFIVAFISVDRYLAVCRPFLIRESVQRAKILLSVAWVASGASSVPEAVLYHVHSSPFEPQRMQCTSAGFYSSLEAELVHSMIKITLTGLPFVVIVACYLQILWTIYKTKGDNIRRSSGNELLGRAQVRALKIFVIIALAFLLCWVPGTVIALWSWLDLKTALLINPQVSMVAFLLSYASPCVNPLVYAYFHVKK